MKKLLATTLAVAGLAAGFSSPPAKAGSICPEYCVLEGEVAGSGIFPQDKLAVILGYTGVDLRNDVPVVSLGLLDLNVDFVPLAAAAPPPEMKAMKGTGTAKVIDDDPLTADRIWDVSALRTGTLTEGVVELHAASTRSNLLAPQADAFSLRLGFRTSGALTTFAGSFEELYDGSAPAVRTPLEEVTVTASDADGSFTTSVLDAGATYKITASGTYDYDNIRPGQQHADAECSIDTTGPSLIEQQSAVGPGWQPHRYFFLANPQDVVRTDLFDPDPTDDYVDLYVDGRHVDWVPNDPDRVNRLACNEIDHTYVALFSPPVDRAIELRVFDVQYGDNGCATVGCTTNTLQVSIERVSDTPVPGAYGQHVEHTLVHTGDVDGQPTRPLLAGRTYAVEVRGMYKYEGGFGQLKYADAECIRNGTADNGLYRPHRYDGVLGISDPLDVYLDGQAVDWEPLGRTPAELSSSDNAQCSPIHAYRTTVIGTGAPLHLLVKDLSSSAYTNNEGTLRADIIELG